MFVGRFVSCPRGMALAMSGHHQPLQDALVPREVERAHRRRLVGAIAETAAFVTAIGGAAALLFWAATSGLFKPDVYYATCDEARLAGAAPLMRSDPGFRAALDRDGDGLACETFGL